MNLEQAYYELKFENAVLRAKGDEFQTFFEKLMGLAYKADFMACRPWSIPHDAVTGNMTLAGLASRFAVR